MSPRLETLSIEAGLACDGTDFDDAAIVKFAELVTQELLVELDWLIATRQPASTYVQILKEVKWLR